MEFRGIYENGVIRPTEPLNLPEGTEVEFHVAEDANGSPHRTDEFWVSKTVEDLAREQGVPPLADPASLKGDWPEDESIDDFLDWLRESRQQ